MEQALRMQFLALSIYVAFMGFCFCDGFKLQLVRKLVWFTFFIAVAAYVLKTTGLFVLSLILPFPTLLAIVLGAYEINSRKK